MVGVRVHTCRHTSSWLAESRPQRGHVPLEAPSERREQPLGRRFVDGGIGEDLEQLARQLRPALQLLLVAGAEDAHDHPAGERVVEDADDQLRVDVGSVGPLDDGVETAPDEVAAPGSGRTPRSRRPAARSVTRARGRRPAGRPGSRGASPGDPRPPCWRNGSGPARRWPRPRRAARRAPPVRPARARPVRLPPTRPATLPAPSQAPPRALAAPLPARPAPRKPEPRPDARPRLGPRRSTPARHRPARTTAPRTTPSCRAGPVASRCPTRRPARARCAGPARPVHRAPDPAASGTRGHRR